MKVMAGTNNTDAEVLFPAIKVEAAHFDHLILDKLIPNNGTTKTSALTLDEMKKKPRKKRKSNGMKKPLDAPKRFKSSFIFFSMEKHKEIKAQLAIERKTESTKATNITSLVSQAWRALESTEREKFEDMSRKDKERYDIEKKNYVPPPGMSLTSKRKRDPDAPKRPMSAYLSYANKLRAKVKAENPDCSNGEISKILSGMWKEIPDDERKKLKVDEKALWDVYRIKMKEWRKNNDGRKKGVNVDIFREEDRSNAGGKAKKKKEKLFIPGGVVDFSRSHHDTVVDNDTSVDDHLLCLGGVPGMDGNPNTTDEMMAASALRGVRGGPQQHMGDGAIDPSIINSNSAGYGSLFGVNGTNGMIGMHPMFSGTPSVAPTAQGTATGFGQIDMSSFPYNPCNYPSVGNSHAMIMAQLRGASNNPYQQYPGFLPMDQQPNLSQLASLAGVQNDAAQEEESRQESSNRSI